MKIDWLGHCCFRFVESTGTTIITDPYNPESLGCALPALSADVVTCSHLHENHSFTKGILGNPLIINQPGVAEVKGVAVESFASKRTDGTRNLICRYRMDGVDICHLGDIGTNCTPDLVEEITPVDVLIVPIGGGKYTIDAETARDYVELLMPEVVIPMHFRSDACDNGYNFDSIKEFVRLFDDESILYLDEHRPIEFERDDFSGKGLKILIPSIYQG